MKIIVEGCSSHHVFNRLTVQNVETISASILNSEFWTTAERPVVGQLSAVVVGVWCAGVCVPCRLPLPLKPASRMMCVDGGIDVRALRSMIAQPEGLWKSMVDLNWLELPF